MFWKALLCFVILIKYLKNILNLSSKEPGKNCFYQAVHKLFDVVSVSLGFRTYMIYLYNFGIRGECKCVGRRTILQSNYLATGIKTIPMEKKCKKAKWLSEEALQRAVKRREVKSKGEKERYSYLNAEFQRITRRDKKPSSEIDAKK